MSSSSEARRSFAAEPLGDKSVTDLAGVCEALGARLKAAGFDEVFRVTIFISSDLNKYYS